jgi:hypothetical protein
MLHELRVSAVEVEFQSWMELEAADVLAHPEAAVTFQYRTYQEFVPSWCGTRSLYVCIERCSTYCLN